MNEFRNDLNNAMGQLSADRDIVSSAKIRAAAERPERKISAKRIFCTAFAVCAFLICGVTVAAATGLIDFEAVFGDYIVVKNSELANSLVGKVKNFKYKVSDSDYKIEIKGVTGSDKQVIVIAEISCVDGTPVTDHFVNPVPPDEFLACLWSEQDIPMTGYSSSGDIYINEAGNIEVVGEFAGDGTKLSGKKIIISGENFYPSRAYWNFQEENNVSYVKWNNLNFSGYALRIDGGVTNENRTPADVDDSGVIALDLEWEFSFMYTASDKSVEVKSVNAPEDSFTLNQNVYNIHDTSDTFICELNVQPTYIEAGSTGGRVDFEYEATGFEDNLDYVSNIYKNNEIYIIMSDGERIPGSFGGGTAAPNGNIYKCSYNIIYSDENYRKIFVNADDIEAISINGTVYELQ